MLICIEMQFINRFLKYLGLWINSMKVCQLTARPSLPLIILIFAIFPTVQQHISNNADLELFVNLESSPQLVTLLSKDAFIYQILHFLNLDRTYTSDQYLNSIFLDIQKVLFVH
jgi:hypothetical protein